MQYEIYYNINYNYRKSECLWLSKRTSSTLELLNLESFHSISLRRKYDKRTTFQRRIYCKSECSRPECSTTVSYYQATSKGYTVKKRSKPLNFGQTYVTTGVYIYIICHRRRFSLPCTLCSNTVKQGSKSRVPWLLKKCFFQSYGTFSSPEKFKIQKGTVFKTFLCLYDIPTSK